MAIADEYERVLKEEGSKLEKDDTFSKTLQKIDELKASGILEKKTYRFPMPDTLGKRFVSPEPAKDK